MPKKRIKPEPRNSTVRRGQGRELAPTKGVQETIDAVTAHIERHVGPIHRVYHEIVSEIVHIDVYHVAPSAERPFHTLVTSGMSDLPMKVPEMPGRKAYAELVVLLPGSWPVSEEAFRREKYHWPFRELKSLARYPHEFGTWFDFGHTIANCDPPEPYYRGVGFAAMLLVYPLSLPGFGCLDAADGRHIHFLELIPLYPEEMDFKLQNGAEALLDRFSLYGVSDVIDPRRRNTCANVVVH